LKLNYFMKTLNKTPNSSKKPKTDSNQSVYSSDSSITLIDIAQRDVDGVLHLFDTSLEGLTELLLCLMMIMAPLVFLNDARNLDLFVDRQNRQLLPKYKVGGP